jgi:hypothetical protein
LAVAKFFIDEELHVDTVFPVVAQFAEKSMVAAQKLEESFSGLSLARWWRLPSVIATDCKRLFCGGLWSEVRQVEFTEHGVFSLSDIP